MGDWPLGLKGGGPHESIGITASASRGTTVTASATANTMGAWVQLTAATARESTWCEVHVHSSTAARDYLIDIGIGGAGSEVVLIPYLVSGSGTGSISRGADFRFPLLIPAGARISARCQSGTGSSTIRVSMTLGGGGFTQEAGMGQVSAYGAVAASTAGTTVDPGGTTANTKGAWTQLAASTTAPIRALLIGQCNQLQSTRTSCDWLMDVGIGGAGSEVVVLPDLHFECSTTDDTIIPQARGPWFVDIPTGSRLSVRAACSIITATVRNLSPIIYGVC